MNGTPEVSVVMGVYNGAPHLRETIDSILAQEGVSLEFIIVNDGSTDESPQILEEYAERDSRLRIIRQQNQGLTRALINGCAEAKGRYITRQDVGDVSHPRRLLTQKAAMDECSELSLVSCWTEFCGPRWEFLYLVKGTGRADAPLLIISQAEPNGVIDGPAHHGSVMFRRSCYSAVGGYRAEFYYGQDWDLWYRLAEVGKFQMLEQPLYRARLLASSISALGKKRQAEIGKLSLLALRQRQKGQSEKDTLIAASKIRPVGTKAESNQSKAKWMYFIGECLRRNHDKRSSAYFKRSIRTYPFQLGAYFRLFQISVRSR